MNRRRHARRLPILKLAIVGAAGFSTFALLGMNGSANGEATAPAPPAALAHIAQLNRDAATSAAVRRREEGRATVQAADAAAESHDRAVAAGARP